MAGDADYVRPLMQRGADVWAPPSPSGLRSVLELRR
jgi:hypothetical protein